jgi:N-methylhydantoinase A
VPAQAGVLSALGMLAAPPGRQLTRASAGLLGEQRDDAIEQSLRNLAEAAVRELQDEGIARQDILLEFSLDLRYRGQSACLNLGWSSVDGCKRAFQQLHQQRYGHQVDAPVELVNLCASVRGSAAMTTLPPETRDDPVPAAGQTNVYWRSGLKHKQPVFGPALIVDRHSCVLVERDWRADPDRHGNLVLTWQPAETAKSAP